MSTIVTKAAALNDGNSMPFIGVGLGSWQPSDDTETLEQAVEIALCAGHTHFDTSPPNDQSVGRVLKNWIEAGKIKREDLFIVSKLPMIAMWPYRVNEFLRESLAALQVDYVDLYMIQFPVGLKLPTNAVATGAAALSEPPRDSNGQIAFDQTHLEAIWRAMENEVRVGRTKSIGLCDFNQEQIERILTISVTPPAVLQTEVNVYHQQKSLREFCRAKNIAVCAYAPLGNSDITDLQTYYGSKFAEDPTLRVKRNPFVINLARQYGKTPCQILLRFLVQSNVVVVPKVLTAYDLKNCIKVYNFELTAEEMKALTELDKGEEGHLAKTLLTEMFTGIEGHPEFPWTTK